MSQETPPILPRTIATAAFCALSLGASSSATPQAPLPRPIVIGTAPTSGSAEVAPKLEYRGSFPALMADDVVRGAVLGLEARLTEFLGAGHGIRFLFEEVISPDDPDQEPLLYAIALLPDDASDRLLDEFILEVWSAQPIEVRTAVRIGREFI